jgi:hypothetical protein
VAIERTSKKICVVHEDNAATYRHVGSNYMCPDKRAHDHYCPSAVERHVAAKKMRYCGKHKRVAYFVNLGSMEIRLSRNGGALSVQYIRNGNPLLKIQKAR